MPASYEVIDLCSSPERPPAVKKEPRDELVIVHAKPASKPATTQTNADSTGLLGKLNKAQRRAVTARNDTVAILAGPGSGKTHTLTSRVAWLINVAGYQPQNVIVTTFTVKAAREMKERLGKVLSEGREKRLVLGTFHGVARRYLAAYGRHIGVPSNFGILDDSDTRAILTRIVKRLQLQIDTGMARGWISKKKSRGCLGDAQEAAKKIGQSQSKLKSAANDEQIKNLEAIYTAYQNHLESLNLLDFDDLLVKCADLLRAYPRCVSNVQAVLVDEFQDTNGIQFELMGLLAQARNRITVVGDPDQSIYGWRSAEVTNLLRFLERYPGTAEVALEENYRSSRSILTSSLAVIQQDPDRYDKSLLPIHKKGVLPVLRRLRDADTEARWIVTEIQRAVTLSGFMLNHGDFAILVRSASLTRPIEQALGSAGVPYRMVGGHKFFDRAEVKVLVDYLRVVLQPHNNDTLIRIVNVPLRGVGGVTCQEMLDIAEKTGISIWDIIGQHLRGERTIEKMSQKAEYKVREGLVGMIRFLQRLVARSSGADANAETDPAGVLAAGETMEEAKAAILQDENGMEDNDTKEGILKNEDDMGGDDLKEGIAKDDDDDDDDTKEEIMKDEDAKGDAVIGAPQPLGLVGLIETLIRRLDYENYIAAKYPDEQGSRWSNVLEFIALASQFERESLAEEDDLPEVEGEEQTKQTCRLGRFLHNITLVTDVDKKSKKKVLTPAEERKRDMEVRKRMQETGQRPSQGSSQGPGQGPGQGEEEERPMVTISTIHAAKGLEWPVVFIPAAYDGMLPHSRTEDTAEERRLLYVAMTRAKCLLNISYAVFDFRNNNKEEERKNKEVSRFLDPIASGCFAETGPSYNRCLLDEMGDILRRTVPSDKDIFAGMPPGMALEDNTYPIDPLENDGQDDDGGSGNGNAIRRRQLGQQQQAKRRKMLDIPVYGTGGGAGGMHKPLQRGYVTTMESAATSFTVASSLPGFTTASSHKRALEEAADAKAAEERAQAAKTAEKGARRPPPQGQKTIQQSFFGRNGAAPTPGQAREGAGKPSAVLQPEPAPTAKQRPADAWQQQEAKKGIPPELTKRKLGLVRTNSLVGKNAIVSVEEKSGDTAAAAAPTKRYAHFSSPPRAKSGPEQSELAKAPAPPQRPQPPGKENRFGAGKPLVGGRPWVPRPATAGRGGVPGAAPRPAASFHSTTFARVSSSGSSIYRKRPAPDEDGRRAHVLRKPFKPPSRV